jgi:urease accessory protein
MKVFTQVLTEPLVDGVSCDSISLSFDERKRGRLKITTDAGEQAGIQIERGQVLRNATVLSNEAGDCLRIHASDEHVSTAYMQDATLFARGCYHLGNRHVPLQVGVGFLRFQTDYVLDDMLRGLGINVIHETAPFEPENGAYAPGTGRSHGHSHDHGDSHSHDDSHSHEHAH